MFPCLWFWSPQWNFPLSGNVDQNIEPNTKWFFGTIEPNAGNGTIEQKAFETASYGRQLGLITEVLLEMAAKFNDFSAEAVESKERLEKIQTQIKDIKKAELEVTAKELEQRLSKLKENYPKQFEVIRPRLAKLLERSA